MKEYQLIMNSRIVLKEILSKEWNTDNLTCTTSDCHYPFEIKGVSMTADDDVRFIEASHHNYWKYTDDAGNLSSSSDLSHFFPQVGLPFDESHQFNSTLLAGILKGTPVDTSITSANFSHFNWDGAFVDDANYPSSSTSTSYWLGGGGYHVQPTCAAAIAADNDLNDDKCKKIGGVFHLELAGGTDTEEYAGFRCRLRVEYPDGTTIDPYPEGSPMTFP